VPGKLSYPLSPFRRINPVVNKARLDEAEQRLAQAEGELATSRALETRLQQRLVGGKTAAEVRSASNEGDVALLTIHARAFELWQLAATTPGLKPFDSCTT
jgi:hypothetical protein